MLIAEAVTPREDPRVSVCCATVPISRPRPILLPRSLRTRSEDVARGRFLAAARPLVPVSETKTLASGEAVACSGSHNDRVLL